MRHCASRERGKASGDQWQHQPWGHPTDQGEPTVASIDVKHDTCSHMECRSPAPPADSPPGLTRSMEEIVGMPSFEGRSGRSQVLMEAEDVRPLRHVLAYFRASRAPGRTLIRHRSRVRAADALLTLADGQWLRTERRVVQPGSARGTFGRWRRGDSEPCWGSGT